MDYWLVTFLLLIDIPAFIWVGKFFFLSWQDFLDDLSFWFQPFWLSLLRGEAVEDVWSSFRVFYFAAICGGLFLVEYLLVKPSFERLFL